MGFRTQSPAPSPCPLTLHRAQPPHPSLHRAQTLRGALRSHKAPGRKLSRGQDPGDSSSQGAPCWAWWPEVTPGGVSCLHTHTPGAPGGSSLWGSRSFCLEAAHRLTPIPLCAWEG